MQKEMNPVHRTKYQSLYRDCQLTFVFLLILAIDLFTPPGAVGQDSWQVVDPSGIHYAVERSVLHPDRWGNELQQTYDCMRPCVVDFDDRLSGVH